MKKINLLAADVGAGSGRVFLSEFNGNKISSREIFRFENHQVSLLGNAYWDFLNIFKNILDGFAAAGRISQTGDIKSAGIDTWGADFGIIDKYGSLLENPLSYRNEITGEMQHFVYNKISSYDLFKINSTKTYSYCALFKLLYYQKYRKDIFKLADTFLPIPSLINYFLTKDKLTDASLLTGTQFFDVGSRAYLRQILEVFDIPAGIIPDFTDAGKIAGVIHKQVASDTGLSTGLKICAVSGHDSASAVNGIPFENNKKDTCFLLSGTWAVMGIETNKPIVNANVFKSDFTNWNTYKNNIIFLKIFNCFYFLQELKKNLEKESGTYKNYEKILKNLNSKTNNDEVLLNLTSRVLFKEHGSTVQNILQYFQLTKQNFESSKENLVKILFTSIVLESKIVFKELELLSGNKFKSLYITGGGSQNNIFCQWLADCLAIEVCAINPESSINGNVIMQLLALNEISSIEEGREIIKNSFNNKYYYPKNKPDIDWAYLEEKYIYLKDMEEEKN